MSFVPAPNFEQMVNNLIEKDLLETASRIAERAGQVTPVGTGRYRDSLRATKDDRGVVAETLDPFGHLAESGSINNPAYAGLRTAAKEFAAEFEPK